MKHQLLREVKFYISMRVTPFDEITAHLWRHFHGDERHYPPGAINVLDVLYEMGIYANVEVSETPPGAQFHYPSLDAAVDGMLEQMILLDTEQVRSEMWGLLEQWLVEQDGVLAAPVEKKMASAVIWWETAFFVLHSDVFTIPHRLNGWF